MLHCCARDCCPVQVTGTKAELMLRVLGAFKLAGPTTAPAALLRALGLERHAYHLLWDGPAAVSGRDKLRNAIYQLKYSRDPAGAAVEAGIVSTQPDADGTLLSVCVCVTAGQGRPACERALQV